MGPTGPRESTAEWLCVRAKFMSCCSHPADQVFLEARPWPSVDLTLHLQWALHQVDEGRRVWKPERKSFPQ